MVRSAPPPQRGFGLELTADQVVDESEAAGTGARADAPLSNNEVDAILADETVCGACLCEHEQDPDPTDGTGIRRVNVVKGQCIVCFLVHMLLFQWLEWEDWSCIC